MNGFILLYRQITDWEWYQNPNTFRVFLHILLKANFTDGRFEGREIKRGQCVTSLDHLSKETKLSVKEVRTALNHLIGTGELASESCNRYRIITVVKYNDYQTEGKQNGSQEASEGQAKGKQGASEGQQYKKNNNNNNVKMEKGNNQFIPDDEAKQIQSEQDRVLDAAEDAGFKMSNTVRAQLIALFADYGMDKMLEGINECATHSAVTLAYLKAVLNGNGKRASPKNSFPQRDYKLTDEKLLSDLAKEMDAFMKEGTDG